MEQQQRPPQKKTAVDSRCHWPSQQATHAANPSGGQKWPSMPTEHTNSQSESRTQVLVLNHLTQVLSWEFHTRRPDARWNITRFTDSWVMLPWQHIINHHLMSVHHAMCMHNKGLFCQHMMKQDIRVNYSFYFCDFSWKLSSHNVLATMWFIKCMYWWALICIATLARFSCIHLLVSHPQIYW